MQKILEVALPNLSFLMHSCSRLCEHSFDLNQMKSLPKRVLCINIKRNKVSSFATFTFKKLGRSHLTSCCLMPVLVLKASERLKKEEKFNNKLCGTHSNFSETIAWRSFERSFILHLECWIRQQFCGNPSQLNVLNCLWKPGTHFCWFNSILLFVWRNSLTTFNPQTNFHFYENITLVTAAFLIYL